MKYSVNARVLTGDEILGGVWTLILSLSIAGAISYGLYRLLAPKSPAETPTQMGRKWLAWSAGIITLAYAPKFIRTFDGNIFGLWLVGLVAVGCMAFVAGWLYGKFWVFKELMAETPLSAPTQPSAFSQPAEQSATPHESTSHSARAEIEQPNEVIQMGDENLYLEATEEVESENRDPALWAKVLALTEGAQDKAKYAYIKLRVEQLAQKKAIEKPTSTKEIVDEFNLKYMPIKEFSSIKGIPDEKIIEMIRDGFYVGHIKNNLWFVSRDEVGKEEQISQHWTIWVSLLFIVLGIFGLLFLYLVVPAVIEEATP